MPLKGKDGLVTLGADTVVDLSSWSLEITREELDASVFGDEWKNTESGQIGWTATVEGFYLPSDTTGQQALQDAILADTLVTDLRLYFDNTSYWTPDVTTDASAGARILSFNPGAEKAALITVSISLSGIGPIAMV